MEASSGEIKMQALSLKVVFLLLLLAIFTLHSQAEAQENASTLCVSLPAGTIIDSNVDPWLNEGWLLNLTGTSWTFNLQVAQTHDTQVSYKTHLVVALNDAAYEALINLTINGITVPKAAFRKGTPKPFSIWTWPNDVYPTWFNDTYINIGSVYPEEPIDLTVSVTFSNTTDVKMHFDAYGKTIPCDTPPKLGEITWSPSTCDSTVIPTPKTPVAAFSYAPKFPIVNEPVLFDASDSYDPDGTIVSYVWDFGDGNITTIGESVIIHKYIAAETYDVTLIVIDNDANTASSSASMYIADYPIAYFTYSPETPICGESVTFNATLSTPNRGYIVSYVWDFDDATPIVIESDPMTDKVYTHPGTYNVTLTVIDSEGLNDTAYKTVRVAIGRPKANFSYSPSYPIVNEIVVFNASASDPNGGHIIEYTWDFGDSNTTATTSPIITHHYILPGTYNVTLFVKDSENLVNATQEKLLVRAYPHAAFTYSPSTPKVEETVTFDAATSEPNGGTIVWYCWNFNDGNTANTTDSIITHTYIVAGDYNVTLTVIDSEELTDMAVQTVTVKPLEPPKSPQAIFVKSPQIPHASQLVTFDASLSKSGFDGVNLCPIVWYYWSFGDGATTNETNPVAKHAYAKAGTYNVTLTVYAPSGNSPEYYPYSSTWQTITVSTPVGGHAVTIDKSALIVRWVGFASVLILAIVLVGVSAKQRSKTVTRSFTTR